jgi:tetraacyldisaccharide 4'-kinase
MKSVVLTPLASIYSKVTGARNWLYDHRFLKTRHLPVPVISVGNFTVGGTGKTPHTILICQRLQEMGAKPLVLSRGYGRSSSGHLLVNPTHPDAAAEFGDEPVLIAKVLGRDVPVVVGADRYRAGCWAFEQSWAKSCDVVVLDDGFQHRKLHRDLDIVLVDFESLAKDQLQMLPLGRAREDVQRAALRASAIVVTKIPEAADYRQQAKSWADQLFAARTVFFSTLRVHDVLSMDGRRKSTAELRGVEVMVACGIARPESFSDLVKQQLGCLVVESQFWPDHYQPDPEDWEKVVQRAQSAAAKFVLVTTKDAVKIPQVGTTASLPLLLVDTQPSLEPEKAFMDLLKNVFASRMQRPLR